MKGVGKMKRGHFESKIVFMGTQSLLKHWVSERHIIEDWRKRAPRSNTHFQ